MEEAAVASKKGYEINKEDAWAHHCSIELLDTYNNLVEKDALALVEKEVSTIVWWDYENLEISAGMNHGLAFEEIVNQLKANGFGGPVQFVVVVGYLDSPMPNLKMMKNTENIKLIITNNFPIKMFFYFGELFVSLM
ncbi:unnamed protein product [Arabidopsis lyrata]|nr:unnamed protein product [Arabidopsis lyrata]